MSSSVCGSNKRSFFEGLPPPPPLFKRVLRRPLHDRGNYLDAAVDSLNELRLGSAEVVSVDAGKLDDDDENASASASGDRPAFNNLPADEAEGCLSRADVTDVLQKENLMLKEQQTERKGM